MKIALTAALMLAALAPVSALRAADITEEKAHGIGVDAYVYFYPLVTMDVTRKQLTNIEAGQGYRRPDEHVQQHPGLPDRRHAGGRAAELRHAVFERLARSDEGADDRLGA